MMVSVEDVVVQQLAVYNPAISLEVRARFQIAISSSFPLKYSELYLEPNHRFAVLAKLLEPIALSDSRFPL